ncbi:MAG: mechanosensitive ion channel family protein [Bacilli bacterium]
MILANTFNDWFNSNLYALIFTLVACIVAIVLVLLMKLIFYKTRKNGSPKAGSIAKMIQIIIDVLIIMLLILTVLGVWGLETYSGIAIFLGLALIIGFGGKDFVSDIISGMEIVFKNLYETNEIIEYKGEIGKVLNLGVTRTQIQTQDGKVKTISNGLMREVTNLSRGFYQGVVTVQIKDPKKLDETLALLESELPKLKENYTQILEGPVVRGIKEIKDGYPVIEVALKTRIEKKKNIEKALIKEIYYLLNERNISILNAEVCEKHD